MYCNHCVLKRCIKPVIMNVVCRCELLLQQASIHTDNATNQVPIAVVTNPVSNNDTSTSSTDRQSRGAAASFTVRSAEVLNNGRVDLGGNSLGPAASVEEVTSTQEVDEEGGNVLVVLVAVVRHTGKQETLLGGTLKVAVAEVDLLFNVLTLANLIEVLDAELAAADLTILAVIRPSSGINAPAAAVVLTTERVINVETTDEDNTAASLTKSRDDGLGEPAVLAPVNHALEVTAGILVAALAGTFTLNAHEDCLAWVSVQKLVDLLEHVGEVLGAGQRDGECAVDKGELVVIGVGRYTDIHESNTVLELLGNTNSLASNRGQGSVAGGRVVGARDGEDRQGPVIVELTHPRVETGARVDGHEGVLGNIDDSKLVGAIVELLHSGGATRRAGNIGLVAVVLGLEGQAEDLLVVICDANLSALRGKGINVNIDVISASGVALGVKFGVGSGIDQVGE
ncbi:hypothetical protein VHEMI09572 [[Torrubiella] hemipterigena]|uniref:Uncharacterized protein n=1 Tax=[Torrubiella] hemipterigena TaxID=1531966 RepID=A0A0A1TQA0_9HYPO|nr:hypothetical protein VHEMI09572 [[Torrubiella] hemipterigena]